MAGLHREEGEAAEMMNLAEKVQKHNEQMSLRKNCRYIVVHRKDDYVVKFRRNGDFIPLTYCYSKKYAYAVVETLYWLHGYKELKPHRGALKYIRRWIPRLSYGC